MKSSIKASKGPNSEKRVFTMSMMSAMVRMKMAAMAQVFRAQRVWSIHVEKDTSLLGKL